MSTIADDLTTFIAKEAMERRDVAADLAQAILRKSESPLVRLLERMKCEAGCRLWRPDGPNASSGHCVADHCRHELCDEILAAMKGRATP